MSTLLEGRGFAGLVLVVVVAFALGAVTLLTITLLEAEQIEDNAHQVAQRVADANRDLEAVRLAEDTGRITGRIADELQPLDRQLARVVRNTTSIDRTVGSIAATVTVIRNRAGVLQDLVASVHGQVRDVDRRVDLVLGDVRSINDRFGSVLPVTRSIDRGVAGINRRAEAVIAVAQDVEGDLSGVLRQVGPEHGEPLDENVAGHAHSIDCSPLLEPEPYCAPR